MWLDRAAMTPDELRLHNIWRSMRDRCFNSKNSAWKDYGGRGITVCAIWKDDFLQFAKDVGIPEPGLELDRWPNNNGNYEPGNIRWVTHTLNTLNVRSNRPVTIDGITKMMTEWADEYGINRVTFHSRLEAGWKGRRLLTPARAMVFITIDGDKKSAQQWAKIAGLTTYGICARVRRGIKGKALLAPSQKHESNAAKKILQPQK